MEPSTRIERIEKPSQCPTCGYAPIAEILYGYNKMNDDLRKELDEGSVVLGGCVITDDDPFWSCVDCGQKIYKVDVI